MKKRLKIKKNTSENIITKINNISVDNISVCINDESIRQILLGLFPENTRKIKEEVNKYLKEIQWKTFNQKIKDYCYHNYLDILIEEKLLGENILNGFKEDLNDCTEIKRLDKTYKTPIIVKYFKVRPYIKEQGRKKPNSGINKENIESNIFFGFNATEYQNISHIENKNPLKDLLELIKIILFLDLRYLIEDCFEKQITYRVLINSIAIAVENSIVTGIELSNNLISSKYFYEDYCYELSQLTFESSDNSVIINSPSKQSLTFIFKDQKIYRGETPETIENRKETKKTKQKEKADGYNEALNESIIEEIEEERGFTIETIDGELNEYEEEIDEDDNEIDEESKKEKIKTRIAFHKDKNVKDHRGIQVIVKISGREDIQKLLLDSSDKEEVIHSGTILSNMIDSEETIFNNCILGFFNGMKQTKEVFKKVKRSTFSLDVDFIKTNIKVEKNVFPRILMLIHFASSSNEKDDAMEDLLSPRSEIRKLIRELSAKRRGAKSKKAVICLYEHFKERLNAK